MEVPFFSGILMQVRCAVQLRTVPVAPTRHKLKGLRARLCATIVGDEMAKGTKAKSMNIRMHVTSFCRYATRT